MQWINWVFHGRWIFWGVGLAWVLYWTQAKRGKLKDSFIEKYCEAHWKKLAIGICSSFFVFGLLSKISQYYSMSLHGQDFWLFVDLLEQMKKGGFFLTRFAPQSLGIVQHGVVHPMLSWVLLLPFSFLWGSVFTALLYQPLMLSLAGGMLGLLTRKEWGGFKSLGWILAFFASTQVGKILMYEVHPEAGYPFFLFLWLWSLGLDGTSRIRWGALIFASLACAGIKEDSFLVLGPWILFLLLRPQFKAERKWIMLSGILAVAVWGFQSWAVGKWSSGAWGPLNWNGEWVNSQVSLGVLKGRKWSSAGEAWDILKSIAVEQGGWIGWIQKLGKFLVSRPWLSLMVFAPWVLGSLQFWFVTLPIAAVYCVLNGPNLLWNYYSAPFLGTFWYCAVSAFPAWKLQYRSIWVVLAACLLGSSSFDLMVPTSQAKAVRESAQSYLPCLGQKGIVASHLIPWVPLDRVWSDRVPLQEEQWKKVDFALFSPEVGRFEMPDGEVRRMMDYLLSHPQWKMMDQNCQPLAERDLSRAPVVYFSRN
jgi:hypothetical protein